MKAGILLRLGVSLLTAAIVAACGSSSSTVASSTVLRPALDGSGENLFNGVRGGTLTVEDSVDFQHLDPGQAYDAVSTTRSSTRRSGRCSRTCRIRPRRHRRIWRQGRRSSAQTERP